MCIFFCNFAPKLKYACFMQTALLIISTVAVLIFGFWLIQNSQFRNEEKKRQWELKRESQKAVSPYLLQTIRAEFDHNQSQQVYISNEVWDMIVNARDQTASFVIAMAAQLPPQATAQTYATTLMTAYASNGLTPTDKALEELKEEAKTLM